MPYVNVSLSARGTIGKNLRGVEFEQERQAPRTAWGQYFAPGESPGVK
jgi:hypothetical protein